ncbi:MAG: hypothetical protein KC912_02085 [Proteobacteria bacterium]|nr:hypothetical protein [Pseudomonadota bacterium]
MANFILDERASALLQPVLPQLEAAAKVLPSGPAIRVSLGAVDGFGAAFGQQWVLSDRLEGPDLHHPDEVEGAALDRWRRAMATVLEGVALAGLHERFGAQHEAHWWRGVAVALVERAAPSLGVGAAAYLTALVTGDLSGRGAALLFADGDPLERIEAWVETAPTAPVLRDTVVYALRPEGTRAQLPVVALPPPRTAPFRLEGWSFARVMAHGCGGLLAQPNVAGPDVVGARPAVVVAVETAELALVRPVVVGGWDLASVAIPGGILGARGVGFRFYADGQVEILFADAFVGPLHAIELAKTMGHSGMTGGRWSLLGAGHMRFGSIREVPITMHQRDGSQAMPQVGFGVSEWVAAMANSEWSFAMEGGELHLTGRVMDMAVRLRMRPESG